MTPTDDSQILPADIDADGAVAEGAVETDAPAEPVVEAPVAAPNAEVESLKAELSALKDLILQQTLAKQPEKAAEVVETPEPEPDPKVNPMGWLQWNSRQETKAALNPLRAEINALKAELAQVRPLATERQYLNEFRTAFSDAAKADPTLGKPEVGNRVAAVIDGDEVLTSIAASNPKAAIALAFDRVKSQDQAKALQAQLAKAQGRQAGAAAAAPFAGTRGTAGQKVAGVPKDAEEAFQQVLAEINAGAR